MILYYNIAPESGLIREVVSLEGCNVLFYYNIAPESGLIREVAFEWSDLIKGGTTVMVLDKKIIIKQCLIHVHVY